LAPAGDAYAFPARQRGFQIGGTGRSQTRNDLFVGPFDVDDYGFGEAVLFLERLFDLGVEAWSDGDDGTNDPNSAARLRSRDTRACEM
jgi:hypothetical protein